MRKPSLLPTLLGALLLLLVVGGVNYARGRPFDSAFIDGLTAACIYIALRLFLGRRKKES